MSIYRTAMALAFLIFGTLFTSGISVKMTNENLAGLICWCAGAIIISMDFGDKNA